MIGQSGFSVTDGINTLQHLSDGVEHLFGGAGDDWFMMLPNAALAGGRGTISGGAGTDVISYEHYAQYYHRSIYNGVGLAQPADVEQVILPPEKPVTENVLLELLLQFGAGKTLDEVIDHLEQAASTYRASGSGIAVPLKPEVPTAVMTLSGSMVAFSSDITGVATVTDLLVAGLSDPLLIRPGMSFLGQSGRLTTFGAGASLIQALMVRLLTGDGEQGAVQSGESMAVIFQVPAHMLGYDLAIMWWNEAHGMWQELDTIITPDGRTIAVTKLTGTFALVAKE